MGNFLVFAETCCKKISSYLPRHSGNFRIFGGKFPRSCIDIAKITFFAGVGKFPPIFRNIKRNIFVLAWM